MALDSTKLFEVRNGVRIFDGSTDGPITTGGPASPVGLAFPVDSMYLQNTATGTHIWRKWGSGNNDWVIAQPVDFKQYAESLGSSSTTSATYSTKVSITTPTLVAGTYRIAANFMAYTTGLLSGGNIRLQEDGVDVYAHALSVGQNEYMQYVVRHRPLTNAAHTYNLQYNRTGGTAFILNASLEFWRVD